MNHLINKGIYQQLYKQTNFQCISFLFFRISYDLRHIFNYLCMIPTSLFSVTRLIAKSINLHIFWFSLTLFCISSSSFFHPLRAHTHVNKKKKKTDQRTKPWLLSGTPGPLFTILGTYLYFCLYAGPKYMKDRKPFELKNTLIIYNIVQVVLSVVLVIEVKCVTDKEEEKNSSNTTATTRICNHRI